MSRWSLSRRSFLFGAGNTVIALPLLEAMFASDRALAGSEGRPPRFAFVFYPNGSVEYEMSPTSLDDLGGVLTPLQPFRSELVPVLGLNNRDNSTWEINGVDLGSGTPHEINAPTFLTCQRLGSLAELSLSRSIDQVIGEHLQAQWNTPQASIFVGDGEGSTGVGQGGVNRAYHHLMSWKSATQYVTPISRTVEMFEEIYGGQPMPNMPDPAYEALRARKKSILDSTSSQLQAMKLRVGEADRTRIELYLDTVRELEKKIFAEPPTAACPDTREPADHDPKEVEEFPPYLDTMSDHVVLALQCRVTPVAVFQLSRGNDGVRSGVGGVSSDQHGVSHFRSGGSEDALRQINTFYNERAAYFLGRLAAVDELGQPLLDSTLTLYGTGIGDADYHDGGNCTVFLAGGRALGVATDRVLDLGLGSKDYGEGVPLADLHVGLAQLAGVDIESFGNSTGTIDLTR
jgi:hypothetical protein